MRGLHLVFEPSLFVCLFVCLFIYLFIYLFIVVVVLGVGGGRVCAFYNFFFSDATMVHIIRPHLIKTSKTTPNSVRTTL